MENSLGSAVAGKNILIVDDELGIVEVLEFILADAGYSVTSALNGQEALERLKERRADVVLLDLMMPILDGGGVLKAMRQDPKYAATPVILTSALPEDTVRAQCSGFNVFLRKPFKSERLLEAIRSFFSADSKAAG